MAGASASAAAPVAVGSSLIALIVFVALVMFVETARRGFKFIKNKFVDKKVGRKTIIGQDYTWVFTSSTVIESDDQFVPIIRRVFYNSTDEEEEEEQGKWWNDVSVAYGPFYRGLESDTWKTAKHEAWKHLLRKSNDEGDENETTRRYIDAMKGVEREARELYFENSSSSSSSSSTVISSLSSDEFIWIMILDGCFLLQIALFVLGGSEQLGHPMDDPIFGQQQGGKNVLIRAAMSSMFIVGNQIPNLVLKELMKQSFFRRVFHKGIWQQPLGLERYVLFKLLLIPILDARVVGRGALYLPTAWLRDYVFLKRFMYKPLESLRRFQLVRIIRSLQFSLRLSLYSLRTKRVRVRVHSEEPTDLLHGLWLFMTGLTPNSKENKKDSDHQDIESIISNSDYFDDFVLPTVRSATELKEAGIAFKYNNKLGTTNIRFENFVFNAFLVLPRMTIDRGSEMLLSNLMDYEVTQGLGEKERKVCAYMQLMRELIRSSDDAKLLARSGVILVDPKQEEQLPKLFQELSIPKVKPNSSLSRVRYQLINHAQPSIFRQKLSDILSLVILLAAIQTVYAILSFHLKKG